MQAGVAALAPDALTHFLEPQRMTYLEPMPGLSRFAAADERARRKAEEKERIKKLWDGLINPVPAPLGPRARRSRDRV